MFGLVLGRGGIDCHAADGIARIGVRSGRLRLRRQKPRGISEEFLAATVAAEVIGRARMLRLVLGADGIDRHAADGIARMAFRKRGFEQRRHGVRRGGRMRIV